MVGRNDRDHCIGFGNGCRRGSRTTAIEIRCFVKAEAGIHNRHFNGFTCHSKNAL
jgi:hypothetical protein